MYTISPSLTLTLPTDASATIGEFGNNNDIPLVISTLHCFGSEQYLANCTHYNVDSTPRRDVGIQCFRDDGNELCISFICMISVFSQTGSHIIIMFCCVVGNCSLGDIRLSNGSNGRMEVCVNGTWGSVCGTNRWTQYETIVVCRQLGYPEAGTIHQYIHVYVHVLLLLIY